MGATKKQIGTISIVTDHDCGNYKIGEIWEDPALMVEEYLQKYGEFGYSEIKDYAIRLLEVSTAQIKQQRIKQYENQAQGN